MIQQITDAGIINIFKGKNAEPIKLVIGEILTAEIMDIFPSGTVQVKINDRILNAQLQRQIPLNKGDVVYVKVETPLTDGTVPLRILSLPEQEVLLEFIQKASDSSVLSQAKSLTGDPQLNLQNLLTLIESLFKNEAPLSQQQTRGLIESLLSTAFKNISYNEKVAIMEKIFNLISNASSTTQNIAELIEIIASKEAFKSHAEALKNFVASTLDLTAEKLKEAVLNSGTVFEAKLKNLLTEAVKPENIKDDMKTILKTLIEDANIQGAKDVVQKAEQILKQIEGYQVLSHNFKGLFTFLPIFWKELDGGNMAFKSFKREGKDYYTVLVNLNFKEGSLNFLVTMINRSFYVSFSGNPEILEKIKENEQILKDRLTERGISVSGVTYVAKNEELIKQWSIIEGLVSVTV